MGCRVVRTDEFAAAGNSLRLLLIDKAGLEGISSITPGLLVLHSAGASGTSSSARRWRAASASSGEIL